MMLYRNVILAGLSIVFFTLSVFLMKKSQPYFNSQQELPGHLVIKSFGSYDHTKQNLSVSNNKLAKDTWISKFISGMMMLIMSAGGFSVMSLCYAPAYFSCFIMSGGITIGVIAAFVTYSSIFSSMLTSISQFIS